MSNNGIPKPMSSGSRFVATTSVVAALSTIVLLWALFVWVPVEEPIPVRIPEVRPSVTVVNQEASGDDTPSLEPEATSSAPGPAMTVFPPGRLIEPQNIEALLSEEFQFRSDSGNLRFAKLRSALDGKHEVTIINVWAPYCEPCKREFPGFRSMQAAWGSKVQFLPIQMGEGEPGELKLAMPAASHHLIDYVPGGVVQQTLAKLDLLPENMPIPITLVLDCKDQLRWMQAGEVQDMAAFSGAIAVLTNEMSSRYCEKQVLPHGLCGNGSCDQRREDCDSCPEDCKCGPGQLCAHQDGSSRHLCSDGVE